jgi:predicted dehydrogenase
MDSRLVICQIGCGYWGPNLLRSFSAQASCWVKWVAERSAQRRAFVKEHFPKTNVVADWEAAVHDTAVKAVVIATPAVSHYALARAALEAGKHVFVEKPLATSTREVDELASLAASGRLVLMVGHTFLYNTAVRYLKRLLEEGELGKVYYIYTQRLNLGQARSDVNAWWNLAPHDISILLYLLNEPPVSVAASGVDHIQPGIEDVVFATLTWANRIVAHVQVSWLDPGKVRKVTLVGSRKMIVFDDVSEDKIAVLDKGVDRIPKLGERMDYDDICGYQLLHRTGDILLPHIDVSEPLAVEAAHFLDCVRTGRAPLTGSQHARDVVAVLEAGQHSLKDQGRAFPVVSNGAVQP